MNVALKTRELLAYAPLFSTVVAEVTYADREHAAVNSAILQIVAAECGPTLFASTPLHHACVLDALDGVAFSPIQQDIAVLPPGGVHLRRMRAQWRVLTGLVRDHRPRTLVLLSAGPETLFVARTLVARHPALHMFVVLHGNLSEVVGWRSRDPRRRLIDLRSGLAITRHPRIRFVVLDQHIRDAAARAGLSHQLLVWPLPCLGHDSASYAAWTPGPRLRLGFVGTANRQKGFDDFLALHRTAGPDYDWLLVGKLTAGYSPADLAGIEWTGELLSPARFLTQVRRVDYAVMAFHKNYEFTASGSLLDCFAQRKPIIAVENPMLAAFARRYGPIGYLCPDLSAAQALLADLSTLRDPIRYAGFQRSLDAINADRGPQALAPIIRRDLAA